MKGSLWKRVFVTVLELVVTVVVEGIVCDTIEKVFKTKAINPFNLVKRGN